MNTDNADALLTYLLVRELVSRRSAVDGNVIVISDPARMRFRVLDKEHTQLFAHRGGEGFARALAVAELVRDDPRLAALRPLLPEIVDIDREEKLLVLRTSGGANDVIEYHRSAARPADWLPPLLGWWLAAWHAASAAVAINSVLPRDLPSSLTDGGTLARNAPAVAQEIAQVAAAWQPRTIIHGWIDFERIFITSAADRRIQLAGWDDARIGDPAWDVGGVIESYYAWALDPALVSVVDGPACLVDSAQLRLLIGSFWSAYASTAALSPAEGRTFLLRAFAHAGARMVARINRTLDKAEASESLTPMVQAAVAMLATPAAVADAFISPAPARPQVWGR